MQETSKEASERISRLMQESASSQADGRTTFAPRKREPLTDPGETIYCWFLGFRTPAGSTTPD